MPAWDSAPLVEANSFKDPSYDGYEKLASEKTGVPVDFLKNIRTKGERSNASQVSNKGARTVYQIIPSTRDAVLKKYGVDAYKGGQEAALAAAYISKEALDKHGGNEKLAAMEYHGGGDTANWGKKTKAYGKAVAGNQSSAPVWESAPIVNEQPPRTTDLSRTVQQQPQQGARQTQFAQEADPWGPYIVDQAKKGLAGTLSFPARLLAAGAQNALQGLTGLQGLQDKNLSPLQKYIRSKALDLSKRSAQRGEAMGKSAEQALGVKNIPVPKDITGQESLTARFLGNAASFTAAGALPGAGVVAAAPRKLAALGTELAGALIAGESATMGGELAAHHAGQLGLPKDETQARNTGELLGGVLGPVAVAKYLTGNIQKAQAKAAEKGISAPPGALLMVSKIPVVGKLFRGDTNEAARLVGLKEIQHGLAAHAQSPAEVAQAEKLGKEIPGFNPKIDVASNAPELLAMKRSLMGKHADLLAKGAEQKAQMEGAIAAHENTVFPESRVASTAPAVAKYQSTAKGLENRVKRLDKEIRAVGDKYRATGKQEFGDRVRDLAEEKSQQLNKINKNNYDAAYAEAERTNARADTRPILQAAGQSITADENFWRDKSPTMYKILTAYKPKMAGNVPVFQKISFKEFHGLYKQIGQEIASAESRGNTGLAQTLRPVQQALYQQVKSFEDPKYGNLASLFRKANEFHATSVVPDFVKGLGGRLDAEARFGEATTSERVFDRLVSTPSGVDEYLSALGDDPRAIKALRDGATDSFSRYAVRGGKIDPGKAQTWLRNHDEFLRKIPDNGELRKQLRTDTGRTFAMQTRREAVLNDRKQLDHTLLGKIYKSDNVGGIIDNAVKNPAELGRLVATTGKNQFARQSLAREVAARISRMGNAEEYLNANAAQLKPIMDSLGKGHWNNLMSLTQARKIAGRLEVPTTVQPPEYEGFVKKYLGTDFPGLWSRFFGNVRTGEAYKSAYLGGRFIYKIAREDVEKSLEAALFDADLTKVLADMNKQKVPTQVQINSVRNHLLAHGIRLIGVAQAKYNNKDKEQQ